MSCENLSLEELRRLLPPSTSSCATFCCCMSFVHAIFASVLRQLRQLRRRIQPCLLYCIVLYCTVYCTLMLLPIGIRLGNDESAGPKTAEATTVMSRMVTPPSRRTPRRRVSADVVRMSPRRPTPLYRPVHVVGGAVRAFLGTRPSASVSRRLAGGPPVNVGVSLPS